MSRTLKGISAAICGIALLIANDAVTKFLAESYPVGQVICLRQGATLLVIAPYVLLVTGGGALRIVSGAGQLARGLLFVAGTVCMVLSLSLLPLATVITILFAGPTFVAALSWPLLAERVTRHRWIAIIAGFAGVFIVVRPGAVSFEWALLIPVAGAFVTALRDIVTRRLSRTETSISILFWSSVVVTAVAATTAPFGWQQLNGTAAAWFMAAGLLSAAAHLLMIESLRLAEAAVVAPVRYTSLIWATLFGFMFWGELPDAWVVLGAIVIVASGVYMLRVETRTRVEGRP